MKDGIHSFAMTNEIRWLRDIHAAGDTRAERMDIDRGMRRRTQIYDANIVTFLSQVPNKVLPEKSGSASEEYARHPLTLYQKTRVTDMIASIPCLPSYPPDKRTESFIERLKAAQAPHAGNPIRKNKDDLLRTQGRETIASMARTRSSRPS